jgi:hypothetical protein
MKAKTKELLTNKCPYCGALPNQPCRITGKGGFNAGLEPRNKYGIPVVHNLRTINIKRSYLDFAPENYPELKKEMEA